jgi:hypothetical protein
MAVDFFQNSKKIFPIFYTRLIFEVQSGFEENVIAPNGMAGESPNKNFTIATKDELSRYAN